ncbi:hypothetical protein [Streptomyces sp. NPDC002402]
MTTADDDGGSTTMADQRAYLVTGDGTGIGAATARLLGCVTALGPGTLACDFRIEPRAPHA